VTLIQSTVPLRVSAIIDEVTGEVVDAGQLTGLSPSCRRT
jgi:hypothetical protein